MSILKTLNYLQSSSSIEFLKDPSLVLYSSSYTPLLSVLSYLIQQQTPTSMLMILNLSLSQLWISLVTSLTKKTLYLTYSAGCLPISSLLILLNRSFLSLVYHNKSLNSIILRFIYLTMSYSHQPVDSARNIGAIFDKILSFAQHISAISKSCFHKICDKRRIRNTIDQTTACTIATSLIHSKNDYCNTLLLNLPATQTNCLQLVLNSAAHAVTKTPKFHHITPILKYLHWLTTNMRIK